jgi:hypothetical protein
MSIQAMNGSVVSSVTDKFGFMWEEGGHHEDSNRPGDEAATSSGLHTDLEILRDGQPSGGTPNKVSGMDSVCSYLRMPPPTLGGGHPHTSFVGNILKEKKRRRKEGNAKEKERNIR